MNTRTRLKSAPRPRIVVVTLAAAFMADLDLSWLSHAQRDNSSGDKSYAIVSHHL
jgi:hypothetical protein